MSNKDVVETFLSIYKKQIATTVGEMSNNLMKAGFSNYIPEWLTSFPKACYITESMAKNWLKYLMELEETV